MRLINTTAAWMLCVAFACAVSAQEPETTSAATEEEQFESPALEYQTGDIVLPNKVATLHLGNEYRYLDPANAEKVLVAWGNPPGAETQGAIVPNDVDPFTQQGWAVFLTYVDDGHIDDSEAAEIDYADLLKDMQEGTEDSNAARKEAGYPEIHLVGWAEQPHYDANAKKLYWAQHLRGSGGQDSLNYDVRVLGREGVLSMNAVAGMDQLESVRQDMRPLIGIAEFNEGYRYAEFNPKTDRMAEYGLGALIAGGVAAKLGLFAKLGAFLLAFKKFIFIGVIALGGLIAKFFGRKKEESV
ncbi:MAG: rane protein [Steroidobacteraceae bacterium]|nr:rane protein [Steroidobacteraceae bacterium]